MYLVRYLEFSWSKIPLETRRRFHLFIAECVTVTVFAKVMNKITLVASLRQGIEIGVYCEHIYTHAVPLFVYENLSLLFSDTCCEE